MFSPAAGASVLLMVGALGAPGASGVLVDAVQSVSAPAAAAQLVSAPARASASAPAAGIARSSIRWLRGEGSTLVLAVTVEPQPGWHVYWRNPGDSGDSPSFALQLPEGWAADAAVFARPEAAIVDDGVFYGYSHAVTYLVPVRKSGEDAAAKRAPDAAAKSGDGGAAAMPGSDAAAPGAARAGDWRLSAKVMACKGMCVVSAITGGGAWPPDVAGSSALSTAGGTFEGRSLPASAASAGVTARIDGERVTVEGPAQGRTVVSFIPDSVPGMQVVLPEGKAAIEGSVSNDRFRLEFRLETPGEGAGQPRLAGLVMLGNAPADPCVWLAVPQEGARPMPAPSSVPVRRGASDAPPAAK